MDMIQEKTYESIYYQLWELSQRYKTFTQFRVIGKSHDDRMIPMLEIGTGDTCIFVWPVFGCRLDDVGQANRGDNGTLQELRMWLDGKGVL